MICVLAIMHSYLQGLYLDSVDWSEITITIGGEKCEIINIDEEGEVCNDNNHYPHAVIKDLPLIQTLLCSPPSEPPGGTAVPVIVSIYYAYYGSCKCYVPLL